MRDAKSTAERPHALVAGLVSASFLRSVVTAAALALCVLDGSAHAARTLKVRFPTLTLPPGANIEACVYVRVPRRTAFEMTSFNIQHRGIAGDVAMRHFLVYRYDGNQAAGFTPNAVVLSRGCLDLGPADRDRRQLIANGPARRSRGFVTPPGMAIPLAPVAAAPDATPDTIGFILDAEILNGTTTDRKVSSTIVFKSQPRKRIRGLLQPLEDASAERAFRVAPGTVQASEASTAAWNAAHLSDPPLVDGWFPTTNACVTRVTTHTHKRNRFVGVDLRAANGDQLPPSDGIDNPFESGRSHLFGAPDYTDPGERVFTTPLLVRAGESLHTACWADNGVARPARFGCEETIGVTPGGAAADGGAPAKPCTVAGVNPAECPGTDAAYPGRTFTGACVTANLVAGTTVEDEVCRLAGFYFDAVPGAVGVAACDPNGLPARP